MAASGARAGDGATSYAPYLPRLVVEWLDEGAQARFRTVEGTLVFVDISGFTKLSERLAKRGKVGAEELAEAIDGCFDKLLAVAYADGGGLLKFGGDALLLLFSGDDHAVRACHAAGGMRRMLREVGRLEAAGQTVLLHMSVGVHSGAFHLFLVGESHRELLVTGPATSATVLMEATAEADEIVVSEQTAAALSRGALGAVKGPGRLLRRPPSVPLSHDVVTVESRRDLSHGIPVALREWLRSGGHQQEHRRVTVAFLHFDGLDDLISTSGVEEAARRLDVLVTGVQNAADRWTITFLGSDVDRDGGKIILAAGMPTSSGDDERRMLLTLREIIEGDFGIAVRMGVNRGDVFAGDIGPPYRRTFTVMGDAVNLAARLMAKATPGQILSSAEVLARSPTKFETTELEPFLVKGKAKPVRALVVGPATAAKVVEPSASVPLVGRRTEMATLLEAADMAGKGQGRLIELVGEPGLGKSRLVEELRSRAAEMLQLAATCEPYDAATPYFALRHLIRGVLGIGGAIDDAHEADQLQNALIAIDPALVAWTPLIGGIVDVAVPETPQTAQLEERFRRDRVGEVMAQVLTALLPGPTLLTIEDAHWMDEASADLLQRLAPLLQSRPWLVCVTRRDGDKGFVARPPVVTLHLEPLPVDDAVSLLHLATEEAPIPPHQIAALAERSGGNPLYLTELVANARTALSADVLPDNIEALISARIDRLTPDDRSLLRRASVLGRSFSPELLREVLDDLPETADLLERLAGLVRYDDSGNLSFDHALVRDSAYEGLPYRLRRDLHGRVADAIRASVGSTGGDQPELLSLHYLHAQRFEEAWTYALAAAARASAIHAHVEAEQFYERALEASRRLPGLDAHELANVYEELGDVRHRIGSYQRADAAYRSVRRLVKADAVAEARLLLKLSWTQGWMDRYANALRWISRGLRSLEGLEGSDAAQQRAQLLAWYGRFCQEEGRHSRAMKYCRQAIEEADAAGNREALAHALRVLDWALMDLGHLEDASNLHRSLALYEELGDLPGQASVLNMLGGFAYWRGEWDRALELYERARDTVARTGNTVMRAFCLNNIGEIALDQGKLQQAEDLFIEASRVWQAVGYRSGVAFAKCNLARTASGRGRFAEALRLFEESLWEAQDIGAQVEALETRARMSECLVRSGEAESALKVVEETIDRARSLGGTAAQSPLLHRVRSAALAQLGDLAAAGQALEESLSAGRARNADYEIALTIRAQAELERREGKEGGDDRWAASQAIFDRLGVVSVPPLLTPSPGIF